MVDNVKILRILGSVNSIDVGQICFEDTPDTDLGYPMFALKHHDSTPYKLLAKSQPGLLTTIRLTGPTTTGTTGFLKHALDGAITGGKISVAELNSFLSDGPITTGGVNTLNNFQGDVTVDGSLYIDVTSSSNSIAISLLDISSALETGGAWEINVANLSGVLSDGQNAAQIDGLDVNLGTPSVGDVLSWSGTEWISDEVVTSLSSETGSALTGDVKAYDGVNMFIETVADGLVFNAVVDGIEYVADSIQLNVGDYVSGNVASTHVLNDGVSYVIDEVTGVPGFYITAEYSNVESFNRLRAHYWYDAGLSSHVVNAAIYNVTLSQWDTIVNLTSSITYNFIDFPVDSTNYIDGSGNVTVRLYHASSGSASHRLHLEYLALIKGYFGGTGLPDFEDYQVVFGYNTALTQTPIFTYNPAQGLHVGLGSNRVTGANRFYAQGQGEFDGLLYMDGGGQLDDDMPLTFGDTLQGSIQLSTVQTLPALMTGVPPSNALIVARNADTTADYNLPAYTHPTIVGLSTGDTNSNRFELSHYDTYMQVTSSAGPIRFSDGYTVSSDWTDLRGIPIFEDASEWSAAYASLGSTNGSIWALIQASGGGDLDDAYNHPTAGAGRSIGASDGAVSIANAGQNILLALSNTNGSSTADLLNLDNPSPGAAALWFGGNAGQLTSAAADGHKIWTNGGALSLGRESTGSYPTKARIRVSDYYGQSLAWHAETQMSVKGDVSEAYVATRVQSILDDFTEFPLAHVRIEGDHGVFIGSTDFDETLPMKKISLGDITTLNDHSLIEALNVSHGQTASNATWASGTITVNWAAGIPLQAVTVDANVTTVNMTPPRGKQFGLRLAISAQGGPFTLTGFSNVSWLGTFNPSVTPVEFEDTCYVYLDCWNDSPGYTGKIIFEA